MVVTERKRAVRRGGGRRQAVGRQAVGGRRVETGGWRQVTGDRRLRDRLDACGRRQVVEQVVRRQAAEDSAYTQHFPF